MILSASRRTDIPAFYSEWFMNRLRAGYVMTRNPMNPMQVKRIALSPVAIDCIVFWTKDPLPLLKHLGEIDNMGYRYYFQFTLTPYDQTLERNLRAKSEIINTFQELGRRVGRERLFWRYDPIILNDILTVDYHIKNFTTMCEQLHKYSNSVTINFVDLYRKLKTTLIREITADEMAHIGVAFAKIARSYGLGIRACCEQTDLTSYGITPASCIDRKTVEALCRHSITAKPDKNQRHGCGCAASVDIGVYNTCKNGCVYCYANYSTASVAANCKRHDPLGEYLTETIQKESL